MQRDTSRLKSRNDAAFRDEPIPAARSAEFLPMMHQRARPSIAATLQIRGIARFRSGLRMSTRGFLFREKKPSTAPACDQLDKAEALRAEKRLKRRISRGGGVHACYGPCYRGLPLITARSPPFLALPVSFFSCAESMFAFAIALSRYPSSEMNYRRARTQNSFHPSSPSYDRVEYSGENYENFSPSPPKLNGAIPLLRQTSFHDAMKQRHSTGVSCIMRRIKMRQKIVTSSRREFLPRDGERMVLIFIFSYIESSGP